MKDYEQLYYDSQYEIKRLKQEIKLLQDQISIYLSFKNKDSEQLKMAIAQAIVQREKRREND